MDVVVDPNWSTDQVGDIFAGFKEGRSVFAEEHECF